MNQFSSFKISLLPAVFLTAILVGSAIARDDGRYAGSPLKPWFDSLRSGKGPCCSDADGIAIADPIGNPRTGATVFGWMENGLLFRMMRSSPSRTAGQTMVWPVKGALGTSIRCFLPGSMT